MVFLEELIENQFLLTRYLFEDIERTDPLTDDQKEERFNLAKAASRVTIKRLFVTMTAQSKVGLAFINLKPVVIWSFLGLGLCQGS